ncbi:hypothetical protein QJQ45_004452 [Haematococcus lacustris]|nr:hypothetical protein QJQ45_004452 [Haematococcus lacustris]
MCSSCIDLQRSLDCVVNRDQHVRETLSVIQDFKAENLQPGEMYNFKEVSALFSKLEEEVRQLVDKASGAFVIEIQHAYHTNALLVKLLLSEGQIHDVHLVVDTAKLENEFLLRQIANSEEKALSRPASDFVRRNVQLDKIGSIATVTLPDAGLMKEKLSLEADAAALRERMQKMQDQTTNIMRERTALNDQLATLKEQLAKTNAALEASEKAQASNKEKLQKEFAKLSAEASGASKASNAEFDDLKKQAEDVKSKLQQTRQQLADNQEKLKESEVQLHQAQSTLEGKLQESTQFQQMKKMMQAKSQEVVDLRKRLLKYEPQSVPSADN